MSDQLAVHRSGCPAAEGPLGKLIELVVQRLTLAHDVAAVKYANGQPIDDRAREREILQDVADALGAGPYQQAGIQFFRDQIEANKVIQRGLHHRWHAHPEEVPAAYPSLAAEVRPKLDRITTQIMEQFESVKKMPRVSLGDVADLVDKRLSAEESARRLPRLHRAAALFAMRSLCAEATRVPAAASCQRRFRLRGYVVAHVDFFFRFAIHAAEALPNGDLKWTFELRHPRYVRCAPVRIRQVDSRGGVMDSAPAAARAGTAVRGLA